MKRLALFFFFDEYGCVDEYISYMLTDLKKNVEKILVVVNGSVNEKGEKVFRSLADDLLIRENVGYDVWAYKAGIEYIGYESLQTYDEFIMMNYTNFGPIFPFQEMFMEMERNESIDFWGLSMSWGNKKDIPEHIQSHFIVVRKSVLESKYFRDYWEKVPKITCFEDALYKHEFVFTKYFAEKGFTWTVYLNIDEYADEIANPLLAYPYIMIKEKRTPLIKRKSFFLSPDWLFGIGLKSNIAQTLRLIEAETDYDVALIWKNMLRTQNMRTIQWNMNPDCIVSDSCMTQTAHEAMILFELQYIEKYQNYKQYLMRFSNDAVVYFKLQTMCSLEMQTEIQAYYERKVNFICDFKEITRTYEIAFLVSDRKEKSDLTDAFNLYDKENFDNLLSSTNAISQLVKCLQTRKELGGLFSDISCDRENLDHIWRKDYKNILHLLEDRQIHVKLEKDRSPIYLQSGICVIRAEWLNEYAALDKTMKKWHISRSLKWVILAIIMQSKGYACGHLYNEQFVSDVISYNEYYYMKTSDCLQGQNVHELKHFNLHEMISLNLKYCKEKKDMLKGWITKRNDT